MTEVTFSKKQITPLMEKYGISSDNETFVKVIQMFDGQTNYQIWAIKNIWGNGIDVRTIETIKNWCAVHQNEIQNLSKKNIVSYSGAMISNLMTEMRNLDMISNVKSTISKFNTAQRGMMTRNILGNINSTNAHCSSEFKKWVKFLSAVETLPLYKREKLISTASAIETFDGLTRHIETVLDKSYDWNREDMLRFMQMKASGCKVVFDANNVVVITVPNFECSKTMCGNGRTSWCITRDASYFKQYVLDPKEGATQYMLFNFNYPENHELAHIGFTVRNGQGITNAHSTKNNSLTGSGISVNGKSVNISTALAQVGVSRNVYVHLKDLVRYGWEIGSVLGFIAAHPNDFAMSVNDKNRLIIRALTNNGLRLISEHTLIPTQNYSVNNDNLFYILMDLNLDVNEDNSYVLISCGKDAYGTHSIKRMVDAYNADITSSGLLSKLNIAVSSFLNKEKIPANILLHKYLDNGSEKDVIELLSNSDETVDVNFEFNDRTPIFTAISKKMFGAFEAIISNPSFDSTTCDGFGEPLLQSLLYNYKVEGITSRSDDEATASMIRIILGSETYDFNAENINFDTAINVACGREETLWVLEALLAKKNIDLNVVNDFNCTCLGEAIRNHNLKALAMIGTRNDLIVRGEDYELAKNCGINLEDYIKPVGEPSTTAKLKENDNVYHELFAKAMARINA